MKSPKKSFLTTFSVLVSLTGWAAEAGAQTVDTTVAAPPAISPERALATKLGLPERFLIGLGHDANGNDPAQASAFTLGPKLDIHYAYLSGLPGENGWTDWNSPAGEYLTMQANAAKAKGVVPMFSLYQAAAHGEGNLAAFDDPAYMTKYWSGVRTMFQRLGEADTPAITHIEPDLWGYLQKQGGDDPAAIPMQVGSVVPECADLPPNAQGFGKCIIRLGRQLAPKTMIGFSASTFGAYTNGVPDPTRVATYLENVAGGQADFVVVETLDRDAGCYEAGTDPNCKRSGSPYWTDADYANHLAWAKTIHTVSGKPLLWWQMPLGAPSATPGGTAGHYRDNRVQYLFSHVAQFAEAGGIGAVFGTGAGNQTTVETDGGQFKNALTQYLAVGGTPLN